MRLTSVLWILCGVCVVAWIALLIITGVHSWVLGVGAMAFFAVAMSREVDRKDA